MEQKLTKYLTTLVYKFLGLPETPQSNSAHMGFIYAGENEEVVKIVMERWVAWKDRLLDSLEEHSPQYAYEFGMRGITFSEFKLIARHEVGEEVMKSSRAFDYFYLIDKTAQIVFTSTIDNEESDYVNYITMLLPFLKAEIPILYSFFLEKKLPLYFPLNKGLDSHLFCPGRSGWGKSTALNLLVYDLIRTSYKKKKETWKRSVIIMEPNSDLVSTILRYKMHFRQKERLIYLDPFISTTCQKFFYDSKIKPKSITQGKNYTFVINPFDLKDTSEEHVNYMIQELTSAFFLIIEEKPSPQMTALLNTCLYVLLKKPNTTIVDLMRFQLDEENEDLIEYGLTLPNPLHRTFLKTFSDNKKLYQTKSSIYYKLHSVLSDDNFRRLMVAPRSTVDLEYEINVKGSIVLLNLSKGRMGAKSGQAYGRLTLSYIFGLIRKRDSIQPHLRKQSFMVMDEQQNYVTETLDEVLAESRKLKLGMILAQQVIGQNTPKETKEIIMGNTAIKCIGDLEPSSVKEVCKQIPELTPKHFTKLKKYTFFIHNALKKEQGVLKLRVPDFLVDTSNTQFYMNEEQLASVLSYLIHDSGLYVPVEEMDDEVMTNRKKEPEIPIEDRTHLLIDKKGTVLTPKFQKKHEE